MASEVFDPEDKHYCYECKKVFPSAFAIAEHRRIRFEKDGSHIHCLICGLTFATKDGLDAHTRQTHAKEQDLSCPGCDAHFIRAAALMAHLEHGKCPKVTKSQLDAKRMKKLAFAGELEKRASPNFPRLLGPGEATDVSNNMAWDAAHAGPARIPDAFSANPVFFRQENFHPRGNKNRQLPPAQTMQITSGEGRHTIAARSSPAAAEYNREVRDAGHGRFDAEQYRDQLTGLYRCPARMCGQNFKSARALASHLRQPDVHNTTGHKLQCPMCFKWFKDVPAMTAHAESQSKRCNIRFSKHYRPFIDQLTAGVVDAVGFHEDNTVKFEVSKDAVDGMRQVQGKAQKLMIDYQTEAAENLQTYWDDRPISDSQW